MYMVTLMLQLSRVSSQLLYNPPGYNVYCGIYANASTHETIQHKRKPNLPHLKLIGSIHLHASTQLLVERHPSAAYGCIYSDIGETPFVSGAISSIIGQFAGMRNKNYQEPKPGFSEPTVQCQKTFRGMKTQGGDAKIYQDGNAKIVQKSQPSVSVTYCFSEASKNSELGAHHFVRVKM